MGLDITAYSYLLAHLDGTGFESVDFVNRDHGVDSAGTNNQEVLRMLIDRVDFLNEEIPWEGNDKIIYHLRMALVLHEARHLERCIEKGKLIPEIAKTGSDGHFLLK